MQNKIQVEVLVKFESGATVTLAKDQLEAVVGFINHMLFGPKAIKQERTVVKRGRKKTHNRWTKEEVDMVREAMVLPAGKQRRDAYRQIARATRRSWQSISNKAWELRKKGNVIIRTTDNTYKPLHTLPVLLG